MDLNKENINKISHILQRSTAQPRLPILPLPPMLPQLQTQIPLPDIITRLAASALRVEPVVKPSRVQPYMTASISPPRVQHAPSPTFDPFTNPSIKIYIIGKIIH